VDQLGKLKLLLRESEKKEVQLLAVSLDSHVDSQKMLKEISEAPGKLDFPLLEDKDHKVVDAYGIYNPAEAAFKPGIPYPTTYVINKNGVVTHRFLDPKNYTRAENEEIREELKKIGAITG